MIKWYYPDNDDEEEEQKSSKKVVQKPENIFKDSSTLQVKDSSFYKENNMMPKELERIPEKNIENEKNNNYKDNNSNNIEVSNRDMEKNEENSNKSQKKDNEKEKSDSEKKLRPSTHEDENFPRIIAPDATMEQQSKSIRENVDQNNEGNIEKKEDSNKSKPFLIEITGKVIPFIQFDNAIYFSNLKFIIK